MRTRLSTAGREDVKDRNLDESSYLVDISALRPRVLKRTNSGRNSILRLFLCDVDVKAIRMVENSPFLSR